MAHAIWSGAINFGLVTIPVKLFTAVKTDELSFNMLHAKDEGRIKYERVCSVDGKPVPWDEIVKGYEFEKGQYVVLTDEDFSRVNPEATQSVDILEFVELDKINPMYFDKPYYLEPDQAGAPRLRAAARGASGEQPRRDRARRGANERVHRCRQTDRRSARSRTHALG